MPVVRQREAAGRSRITAIDPALDPALDPRARRANHDRAPT
jgi:hypothetical protein